MLVCASCRAHLAKAFPPKLRLVSGQGRSFQSSATLCATQQTENAKGTTPMRKVSKQQIPYYKAKTDQSKNAQSRHFNNHLSDPLQLANHTLRLLGKGRREDALRHIQDFGKHQQVVVSWNHMINHDVKQGRISNALRSFNEMKKRGQKPDAYTYTILLRGLGQHTHFKQSLPRAIALYESMFSENSSVKPSIIHTNAVLNVCARAKDLDAVFAITSKLPRSGAGSPDHLTYTTIFNCLRTVALANDEVSESNKHEAKLKQRRLAVLQGRKIWLDVLDRWRRGMSVDEKMVCAMGRLLMLGDTERDYDDVLSLIEQTMALPREVARIGDPARPTHLRLLITPGTKTETALESPNTSESQNQSTSETIPVNEPITEDTALQQTAMLETTTSEFIIPQKSNMLAKPGSNTLSLLVEACMKMKAVQPAHKYWAKLTSRFSPDIENYHSYLRLLRMSRSSNAVLELLKDMDKRSEEGGIGIKPQAKTYMIALSSCVRDSNNQSVLDTATEIMAMMQRNVEDPHLRIAELYDEILSKGRPSWSFKQMQAATDVLEQFWTNVRSIAAYGAWSSDVQTTYDGKSEEKRISRELDPATKDTKVVSTTRRHVDPSFRYNLYVVTKIFRAQIQRVLNRHSIEMNQHEHRQWKAKLKLVGNVLYRIDKNNKAFVGRRKTRGTQEASLDDTFTGDVARLSLQDIDVFEAERGRFQGEKDSRPADKAYKHLA